MCRHQQGDGDCNYCLQESARLQNAFAGRCKCGIGLNHKSAEECAAAMQNMTQEEFVKHAYRTGSASGESGVEK